MEGDDPADAARIADTVRGCLRELEAALDVSAVIDAERRAIQTSGGEPSSSELAGTLGRLFNAPSDAPFATTSTLSRGEGETSR